MFRGIVCIVLLILPLISYAEDTRTMRSAANRGKHQSQEDVDSTDIRVAKNVVGGILCGLGAAIFLGADAAKSGGHESDAYSEGKTNGAVVFAVGLTFLLVGNEKKGVGLKLNQGTPVVAINYKF